VEKDSHRIFAVRFKKSAVLQKKSGSRGKILRNIFRKILVDTQRQLPLHPVQKNGRQKLPEDL
jgi:hypothetical protein